MLLTACMLAASPAGAQSYTPTQQQVADLTARARAALPMARLEDGSNVPPETPEELSRSIVPYSTEIAVIRRGDLSAQMYLCGLDWKGESYMPLMRSLRASGWRGKKMAYVGLLHGISQGRALDDRGKVAGNCGAGPIAALKREAALVPTIAE